MSEKKGTENKGEDYVKQAEAKLKKWSLFGSGNKYEDSLELFEKGAAQFKLNKQWKDAGDTYIKMAEVCEKQKNDDDAVNYYRQAAQAYQNSHPKEAVKIFRLVVKMHMDTDRFSTAATEWKEIAKLEEKEGHIQAAREAWEKAATCHEASNAKAAATQCSLQVARICADEADYKKAVDIFEKSATQALDSELGRWSASEYMYKAALCNFVLESKAGECKETAELVEKYLEQHPAFENAREYKFLKGILEAFEKDDVEKFTEVVFKFDSVLKLDNWTSKLLLKIKDVLKEGVQSGTGTSDKKDGDNSHTDDPLDKLT
jgi:alpha-soluble NSF attachment protein